MGGTVSVFSDNQALVDSLKESCEIPPEIERVFRLVDRGLYAIEPKEQIYSDSAWRVDKLHLSAPGIYATVLRELDIHPGQSVLNIGSGTGYLSTMFGLMLGSNSVNHGIELHESNVAFARERLTKFLASDAIYERDFCEPHFTVGNIFTVVPPSATSARVANAEPSGDFDSEGSSLDEFIHQSLLSPNLNIKPPPLIKRESTDDGKYEFEFWPTYDRIYVGSMISSPAQLEAILRLLNVGGRLVAPIYDQLHKIDRVSDNKVNDTVLISVSFMSLVSSAENDPKVTPPPKRTVERLERLACRRLRQQLRQVILQRAGDLPDLSRFVRIRGSSPSLPSASSVSPDSVSRQSHLGGKSHGGGTSSSTSTTPSASSSSSSSSSLLSSSPRPSAPSTPPLQQQDIPEIPPIHVNVIVPGSRAIAEQMDFVEFISRNILRCQMQQTRDSHRNVEQTIENTDEEETEEGDEEEEEEPMAGAADTGETDADATRRKRRKRKRRRREDGQEESGNPETEQYDDEVEGNRGERRRRGRRVRELTWQPQSYTFREKMHQLMKEELALPLYTTDLVLRVT
ncbi:protein l isoaspartate o methyltransferase [Echinococcus multilocularis]|uniref:Protein l isoaspartate o methyltransferase n=1 Tax=Echinococcus multilocularis TaxID=6211 RepID=A0A068Y6C5_ECHMU|nr:protein l isoaspartate o methyltransferase [Echinococcus multilocularis]